MGYKYSNYTKKVSINSQTYLYNTFSDVLIAIDKELNSFIDNNECSIDEIKLRHSTFFNALLQARFIIDEQSVEWEDVINAWKEEDTTPTKYTIIINPTLNCNMKCWYCYEKHDTNTNMTQAVIHSIQNLISTKVTENDLKGLSIDFFGGEPLLNYKKAVLPILEHAYTECLNNNKNLYASFTTNGYLLSDEIYNQLLKYTKWGDIRLQITLDGNRSFHDKTRALGGLNGTFDKIVDNIKRFAKGKFHIHIRCNYTQENIYSFYDVIEEFADLPYNDKQNMSFSLHKVWQATASQKLREEAILLCHAIKKAGLNCDSLCLSPHRCYAEKENTAIINYNGNTYKCTARDFNEHNKEGVLLECGKIEWNSNYAKRMAIKYGNDECHQCFLFPLCHADCSQHKIEDNRKTCIKEYSEEQKEILMRERVEFLLEQTTVS